MAAKTSGLLLRRVPVKLGQQEQPDAHGLGAVIYPTNHAIFANCPNEHRRRNFRRKHTARRFVHRTGQSRPQKGGFAANLNKLYFVVLPDDRRHAVFGIVPIVPLLTRFSFAVIIAVREIIIRTNQNVAPLPLCAAIVYVIERSAAVKCMAVYKLHTGWNKHAFKRSTSIKRVHIDYALRRRELSPS